MPKVSIPNHYQWALLDESTAQDTDMVAPQGRWRAIHNLHNTAVSLLIPGNQVYQHFDEDADARSAFYAPGNLGQLDANTALANFDGTVTAVDAGTTSNFTGDTSGTVTVTRNGVENPSGVTAPSFDGINWTSSALAALVVNGEGSGLEEGDVITFPLTTNTDITITFTVGQDDLQLKDGIYQKVSDADVTFASILGADEIIYLNVSQFQFKAADGGNDAEIVAYFA